MTKQEVFRLFGLFQAVYPDPFRGLSDEAVQMKLAVWQELFAQIPGEQVFGAARAFIQGDTKGFMPVPGQLIALIGKSQELGEQEAWDLVTRAASRSTYYAQEEFDKLPPQIQRTLGSPATLRSWAAVDVSQLQTVIASHFKRDYRAILSAPALPSGNAGALPQGAEGGCSL